MELYHQACRSPGISGKGRAHCQILWHGALLGFISVAVGEVMAMLIPAALCIALLTPVPPLLTLLVKVNLVMACKELYSVDPAWGVGVDGGAGKTKFDTHVLDN